MMYKQKCFIRKNTLKLRDCLKKLGYTNDSGELGNAISVNDFQGKYMVFEIDEDFENIILPATKAFDCKENEKLFLALAALNNKTDYWQWFVVEDYGWWRCNMENVNCFLYEYDLGGIPYHKATKKEILAKFENGLFNMEIKGNFWHKLANSTCGWSYRKKSKTGHKLNSTRTHLKNMFKKEYKDKLADGTKNKK